MDLHYLLAPFQIEAPHVEVTDLVLDSREVGLNSAFVAINGHQQDGRAFISQAISLGAKVILMDADTPQQHGSISMREHSILVSFYALSDSLSAMAQRFFNSPATAMDLIAVTGTNGKTSTAQLIAQLGHYCDIKSGTVGTLGAGLVGQLSVLNNTTPDAITMQKKLAEMCANGAQRISYEASSHALVQGRIAGLATKVAVFTNLTRDHLDYHGSMQEYASAKLKLLEQPGLQYLVFNQEDMASQQWIDKSSQRLSLVQFGLKQAKHDDMNFVIAKAVQYSYQGTSISLDTSWGSGVLHTSLLGEFNVLNTLAAVAAQLCLGVPLASLITVATKLRPIAGRMELFTNDNLPSIVVDYAHTPDALEKALSATRNHCQGKLWLVFGCGGDRDKGKRPLMGEVAEKYADQVIITNDNVRTESPQDITQQIVAGCLYPDCIHVEYDRKLAIHYAVKKAKSEDVIVLAGKGHEKYQIEGERVIEYDERAFVKQLIEGERV